MPKSYRIRTQPGVNKQVRVNLEQDFDFLEVLSLKLRQEEVYTRFCADYGVVVGRVIANGGFGVPNASVSIFVPLSDIDENDPIISTLYPYKTLRDKNEDGYRYNLLPYVQEYGGHTPTGTFPDREDVLTRKEVLEVYEKYYKYTVKTNDSGDFMIVGVPLGSQKIVMDLDLSNMGQFSLRPADLIRMGMGVPSQFNGQQFKSSEDIDSLPQIVHSVQDIDISSFWGDDNFCDVGITRADFDLRDMGIEIQPQSIFMGSVFSSTEEDFLRKNCKSKSDMGNLCDTVAGPGRMLAIRQTIDVDENGDPVLEVYNIENSGYVIDDNGVWMMELPMNVDYVTTNEFGEQVISKDPSVGIPTKGRYRFKVEWMDEAGLDADIMRAKYLIPNIKEHGWQGSSTSQRPTDDVINKSYAFSLNWDDYYDKNSAINCEDTFYEFYYNKVYTIASHIDRFKWGVNRARHLGIKEINDKKCQSEVNKLPINDGQKNFDLIYLLFNIVLSIIGFLLVVIIPIAHIVLWIRDFLIRVFIKIIRFINRIIRGICNAICGRKIFQNTKFCRNKDCDDRGIEEPEEPEAKNITLPMMTFPDCELCPCEADTVSLDSGDVYVESLLDTYEIPNTSALVNASTRDSYESFGECEINDDYNDNKVTLIAGYDFIENYEFSSYYSPLALQGIDCDNPNNPPNVQALCDDYTQTVDEYSQYFYRNPIFYKSPVYLNGGSGLGVIDINLLSSFVQAQLTGAPDYVIDVNRTDVNVTLSQSLNLVNRRSQYFIEATDDNAPNRIRTKLKNSINLGEPPQVFEGMGGTTNTITNEFEDQVMIMLFDADAGINTGQLLTFHDTKNLFDPNFVEPILDEILYSGITVRNENIISMDPEYSGQITVRWRTYQNVQQLYVLNPGEEYILPGCVKWDSVYFTGAGIGGGDSNLGVAIPGQTCVNPLTSGTTEFNDGTSLITRNMQWIDWEGNLKESQLSLYNDNPDSSYKFKSGVEYFQVITASTIEETLILCNEYDDPNCENIQNEKQGEQWWNLANNVFQQFLMQVDNYQYCGLNPDTDYAGPWPYRSAERFLDFGNLQIAILVRGVDPWTPKQKIEYDLSLLYGYNSYNSVRIIGDYFLNIPIQPNGGDSSSEWYNDYRTPAPHYEVDEVTTTTPYTVSGVTDGTDIDITWFSNSISGGTTYNTFFNSYLFSLDTPTYNFVPFSSDTMAYYSSLDKSLIGNGSDILLNEYMFNGVGGDNNYVEFNALGDSGNNFMSQNIQDVVEGNTLQVTTVEPLDEQANGQTPLERLLDNQNLAPKPTVLSPNGDRTYTISVIYSGLSSSPYTMIDDPNKLVMRSDRLPASDLVETFDFVKHGVTRRYCLNLNNNFGIYSINPEGDFGSLLELSGEPIPATDGTGNLADLEDSGNPLYDSGVLDSFTCDGMVPLDCYSGNAESFAVEDPCDSGTRVVGGCYKILTRPYARRASIRQDQLAAKEWRVRLRFIFGACRGIIGEMFQNNWINGTLYMPTFQKTRIFDNDNEPSYRYCGAPIGTNGTQYNGPIYFNTETNNFYYRSTPYGNETFYGQTPDKEYKGQNKKNIWFPTTIMELGPRDEFLKEVAFSDEFEGYIMDTITTTSHKNNSDVLNLFVIGRLVNGDFLDKIIGGNNGDASINQLFSREGDGLLNNFYDARVDGDYAQLIGINSEYGVLPYIDGNYGDDITISDDRMGIWFSSNTINRRVLTNGVVTLGDTPESPFSTFGYSRSQEVPYYMWELKENEETSFIGLFGSQKNSWHTNTIYSSVYQGDDFYSGASQKYMKPDFGYGLGYLYNRNEEDPQLDALPTQNVNSNRFKVGSPFYFYFGQKRGKSAVNKFIIKYIFNSPI